MIQRSNIPLEELDSSNFDYNHYASDFWHRLDSEWDVKDDIFIPAIESKVIGYCDGLKLPCRPRRGYAVMCEDNEFERFWFHLSEECFSKLCEKMLAKG